MLQADSPKATAEHVEWVLLHCTCGTKCIKSSGFDTNIRCAIVTCPEYHAGSCCTPALCRKQPQSAPHLLSVKLPCGLTGVSCSYQRGYRAPVALALLNPARASFSTSLVGAVCWAPLVFVAPCVSAACSAMHRHMQSFMDRNVKVGGCSSSQMMRETSPKAQGRFRITHRVAHRCPSFSSIWHWHGANGVHPMRGGGG